MALDTKLNLNNFNVEQQSGDTLNLSGNTIINGIINSITGYQLSNTGTTLTKDIGNNLVLTDQIIGSKTLSELASGATRISSNSKNSFVSFENVGNDEFVTIKGFDSNFISKSINNSGETINVLTRAGNFGLNTEVPIEKIHIENGNVLLSGNTTGTTNITLSHPNYSGSSSINLTGSIGSEGTLIWTVLAEPSDTKTSYPTGFYDVGQIYLNSINGLTGNYPQSVSNFNIYLLSALGTMRCEVFDGTGYTGTLLETKDITVGTNDGGNRDFAFDTEIDLTPNQLITFKITKVSGGTFGVGISAVAYTYSTIYDGVLGSDNVDFYVAGYVYSGSSIGSTESLFRLKRIGELDSTEDSKYRGNSRLSTDTKLYLGGGSGVTFQVNGLVGDSQPMTDAFEINNNGVLKSLISGYTSLISENNDIPNIEYISLYGNSNYILTGGSNSNIDILSYNISPTTSPLTEGQTRWNPDENTLDIATGYGTVLQTGQEIHIKVYNNSGGPIAEGTAVYPTGSFQNFPTIGKAITNTHESTEIDFGMTTSQMNDGEWGMVTWFGKVNDIDTSGYNLGDVVYISPSTAGGITNIKPSFPDYAIQIGIVFIVGGIGVGQIFVTGRNTPRDTILSAWDGSIREGFNFTVTSTGGVITGTLVNTDPTRDLTLMFSDGFTILDTTTTPVTKILTAGTDINPQPNYVYILQSDKLLTLSTAGWPASEHTKVAYLLLQSATATETDDALINQNWDDHIKSTGDNGHLLHITERLRKEPAKWDSGTVGTSTIVGAAPSAIYVAVTAGYVYQLHKQAFTAKDTQVSDFMHIANHFTTPYVKVNDLAGQTSDALGVTLANSSFTNVLWGVQNKTGEVSHLMINKPIGKYSKNSPENAVDDLLKYAVYTIPNEFKSVGFLIAAFTYTLDAAGTTWTLYNTQDLRGLQPGNAAGGSSGGGGVTEFTSLVDTPNAYTSQALKFLKVNSGESAVEFIDHAPWTTSLHTGTANTLAAFNASGVAENIAKSTYQAALVSGTNIKTVNGTTLLGSGDLAVGTITGSGTANYVPKFTGVSSLGNSVMFDDGTNVGFGTAVPYNSIHSSIASATARYIQVTNSITGTGSGSSGLLVGVDTSGNAVVNSATAGVDLILKSANAEALRLASTGHVGIGGAPTQKFEVFGTLGNVQISSDGANMDFTRPSTSYFKASVTGGQFAWRTNGSATNAMSLNTAGALTVLSTVTATNFILSSDKRLKENIQDIDFEEIETIPIKSFNLIDDESKRKRYGVIAQDLEKIAPEMVYEDEEGFKKVAYIDFLLAKVNNLEKKNNSLEMRLKKLEEKLNNL